MIGDIEYSNDGDEMDHSVSISGPLYTGLTHDRGVVVDANPDRITYQFVFLSGKYFLFRRNRFHQLTMTIADI